MYETVREHLLRMKNLRCTNPVRPTAAQLVRALHSEIREAIDAGHSYQEIADIFERTEDVSVTPSTIRHCMHDVEKQGKIQGVSDV